MDEKTYVIMIAVDVRGSGLLGCKHGWLQPYMLSLWMLLGIVLRPHLA